MERISKKCRNEQKPNQQIAISLISRKCSLALIASLWKSNLRHGADIKKVVNFLRLWLRFRNKSDIMIKSIDWLESQAH